MKIFQNGRKRNCFKLLVPIVGLLLLASEHAFATGISVTSARIGCLDIQHSGNLTRMVQAACNNRTTCSFKAPTPSAYRRAGVRAATRSFCTQAMEIRYRCPDGISKSAFVNGDAWKHPPALLKCGAPPPRAARGRIHVRSARIGCLDIQKLPNLTSMVARACNNRQVCNFKAPTEAQYKRAGVSARTRFACTQAMEVKYDCGDSRIMTANVPGDAWKHPPAQLVCTPHATTSNYRQTWGYKFTNTTQFQHMVGDYDLAGLKTLYGGCNLSSSCVPELDPMVGLYLGVIDAALGSGQCFGFSLSSLRFRNGDQSLVRFPRTGSELRLWNLNGLEFDSGRNVSPNLSRYLHYQHVLQFSSEAIVYYIHKQLGPHSAALLKRDVMANLRQGAVLSMSDPGKGEGHAVVPYHITQINTSTYGIDVYDPNVPFTTAESNPAQHVSRLGFSRIIVNSNNTYSYNDHNNVNMSGGLDQLVVFPYSLFRHPHAPSLTDLGQIVVGMVFGSSADLAQVQDDKGHTLLMANGKPNTNPRTRLPGSAILPIYDGGLPSGVKVFALNARGNYKIIVKNRRSGNYNFSIVSPKFGAQLNKVTSRVGATDTLTLAPGNRSLAFSTNAGSKPIVMKVLSRNLDKTVDTAQIEETVSKNGNAQMGFGVNGKHLEYKHGNAAGRVKFSLIHAGKTRSNKVLSNTVSLQKGDQMTIKPNWGRNGIPGNGKIMIKNFRGQLKTLPFGINKIKPIK